MNYFRELSTKTPLDFIPSAPEPQNTEYLYKLDVPDVSPLSQGVHLHYGYILGNYLKARTTKNTE